MGTQSDAETTTSPDSRDAARAMNAVRSVVRALRINTRAIEQKMGISLAQLFVLQQLAERPADSLNELADRTATHQSSVSVVVRRLVEAGLVTRTATSDDRRRVQIALTDAGRARLSDAPPTVQLQLIEGLRTFTSAERHELAELLDRWLSASGVDVAATPPMMFEDDVDRA